jgi:hypothetical protein
MNRIQKQIQYDQFGEPIGRLSPLRGIEEDLISFLIILGKIGSPVTKGQGIRLVNEMIDGTIHQSRLIEYKKQRTLNDQSDQDLGQVSDKYWYSFLRKYQHRIVSKKGRRYELDRSKWTRYKNFKEMYDNVEEEMIAAGIAEQLDTPQYMDRNGNCAKTETRRNKINGMKVKVQLKRPDMCIVLDEVGSSLSMVKDGHVGGRRYICEKGDEPKTHASKKDKHFTCLGLTALSGDPVMCIVIVDSVKENLLVRTGINVACSEVDERIRPGDDEFSFLNRNVGPEKLYPGGPSCTFKSKNIPCMVEFNPGGGMTSQILARIFETLDTLEVFKVDREKGLRPFVLLDGHQSRFELEFLKYMNHPDHPWSVCIGVPYGTALWQVGDSTEQNGNFKMTLNRKKEHLLNTRINLMTELDLVPTDIIPLVNYAWDRSFARVQSNQKAINDRGWFPLNRNLLLNPVLRETMTDKDLAEEKEEGLNPMFDTGLRHEQEQTTTTAPKASRLVQVPDMMLTTASNVAESSSTFEDVNMHSNLNFGNGLTQHFLKNIIRKQDREKALEGIKSDKELGINLLDSLSKTKRVTASSLIQGGSYVIGKEVFEVVKDRTEMKRLEIQQKKDKEKSIYDKQVQDANKVIEKNKTKPVEQWSKNDLKILIKPDKLKEDGAMPKNKTELVQLYHKCAGRNRRSSFLNQPMVAIDSEDINETVEVETKPNGEAVQNTRNDASRVKI